MADHALARRDGSRKFVADGVAGLFARNRRIVRRAVPAISKRSILRGMFDGTVVCIHDVARRASAGAIVARLIVRARQGKQRIEQASFLQPEKYRIGAEECAESARAELVVGFACVGCIARGLADFAFRAAAAFEHAQDVAGLRNFPTLQRRDLRQHALCSRLLDGRLWDRSNRLRRAVARVAFAESRVLVRIAAVVVERRAPEDASCRHHAGRDVAHFRGMAPGPAARFRSDAQIAGIYEAHVFGAFLEPLRVQRSGFADRSASFGSRGCGWACRFTCSYSGEADATPEATRASAFPPWQSVQPRRSVPVACMVGSSVCVWQEMHPALLRSASSGVWPIRFGPVFSSAARREGAGILAAIAARSKLTASAANGEACASRAKRFRFFIQRIIDVSMSIALQRLHSD